MSLIIMSLMMLVIIAFFNVILGASFTSYTVGTEYGTIVGVDSLTGALTIIIILVALALVVGIQVLGSGLNDTTVKTIIVITGYASVWGIFSVLSINLIISIQIFGTLIYLFLTIIYVIGVVDKLGSG